MARSPLFKQPLLLWLLVVIAFVIGSLLLEQWAGIELGAGDPRSFARFALLFLGAAIMFQFVGKPGRPYVDYGLVIPPGWQDLAGKLFAIGAVVTLGFVAVIVQLGGAEVSSPVRYAKVLDDIASALAAAVITAYLTEVFYRGFMFTELRRWTGSPVVAALVTSAVFAVASDFEPDQWLTAEGAGLRLVGTFLMGLLLQLIRQRHGTLIAPMALVSGWQLVELFAFRSANLNFVGPPDVLLFGGEFYAAAGFWFVAGIAIAAYAFVPKGRGQEKDGNEAQRAKPDTFATRIGKLLFRYNPFSNVFMFARLEVWLKMLAQARLRVPPVYWPRLAVSLTGSVINTILNLPERFIVPLVVKGRTPPTPIFVVGLHRSGTTLLHTLLSTNARFCAPRIDQVMNPDGSLWVGRVVFFLVAPLLPWRRPMDAMEASPHAPQEDEFAIAFRSGVSPYWSFCLPRTRDRLDRLIYADDMTPAERIAFTGDLRIMLLKLVGRSGLTPVLKSPYHAARVALLAEAFPGARFVHIRRNPTAVYKSTLNMQEAHDFLQVQSNEAGHTLADHLVDQHFVRIEKVCSRDLAALPEGRVSEVRYEDLTAQPMEEMERIYREIGLTFEDDARSALEDYLDANARYRRNIHPPLAPELARRLGEKLGDVYRAGGYDLPEGRP